MPRSAGETVAEINLKEPGQVAVEPTATLTFSQDGEPILWQIACDDEELRLNGRPIVGEPLDQAIVTLGVKRFEDTLWRYDDDPDQQLPDDEPHDPPKKNEKTKKRPIRSRPKTC